MSILPVTLSVLWYKNVGIILAKIHVKLQKFGSYISTCACASACNMNISSHELVILGDFNIRTDLQHTVEAITYSDFLDLFNLKNYVTFPTHHMGHTLDLVLTDNECTIMAEVIQGDFISDHCLID